MGMSSGTSLNARVVSFSNKLAADCHELVIPQSIMRPSIVNASQQTLMNLQSS